MLLPFTATNILLPDGCVPQPGSGSVKVRVGRSIILIRKDSYYHIINISYS